MAVDPLSAQEDVIARDTDLDGLAERLVALGLRSDVVDVAIEAVTE